jgi:hypothetical protein
LALPHEDNTSDPEFEGVYFIKSTMSRLLVAMQCTLVILISYMQLQNIDMMLTMDVLSMYTSYIPLCTVIDILFRLVYYLQPIVCTSGSELTKY